ncbi:unnamed protein product [Sphagnum balticum]
MNRFGRRFTGMLAVNVLSIFSSVLQVAIVAALPQLLTWQYFPSPPKYLYLEKHDEKRALASIEYYHGVTNYASREFRSEVNKLNATGELFAHYDNESRLSKNVPTVPLWQVLHTRQLRIPMLICLLAELSYAVGGGFWSGQGILGLSTI